MQLHFAIYCYIYKGAKNSYIWDKICKNWLSKFCEGQPLKNLLSPHLNALSHIKVVPLKVSSFKTFIFKEKCYHEWSIRLFLSQISSVLFAYRPSTGVYSEPCQTSKVDLYYFQNAIMLEISYFYHSIINQRIHCISVSQLLISRANKKPPQHIRDKSYNNINKRKKTINPWSSHQKQPAEVFCKKKCP